MKKLTNNRSTVTNINYHIVWSTKRRKRVFVPELAADMQVWFREAAQRHGFTTSSFVETIGCISEDVIRRYIHNQDYNAYTERR